VKVCIRDTFFLLLLRVLLVHGASPSTNKQLLLLLCLCLQLLVLLLVALQDRAASCLQG
jgi:hypothetical protein